MLNRDKAIGGVDSACGAMAKKGVFCGFLPWFRVETYVVAGRNRRIWLCKEALFALQRSLLFPLIKPCLHSDAVLLHFLQLVFVLKTLFFKFFVSNFFTFWRASCLIFVSSLVAFLPMPSTCFAPLFPPLRPCCYADGAVGADDKDLLLLAAITAEMFGMLGKKL